MLLILTATFPEQYFLTSHTWNPKWWIFAGQEGSGQRYVRMSGFKPRGSLHSGEPVRTARKLRGRAHGQLMAVRRAFLMVAEGIMSRLAKPKLVLPASER
jgi:hypothetical protein